MLSKQHLIYSINVEKQPCTNPKRVDFKLNSSSFFPLDPFQPHPNKLVQYVLLKKIGQKKTDVLERCLTEKK